MPIVWTQHTRTTFKQEQHEKPTKQKHIFLPIEGKYRSLLVVLINTSDLARPRVYKQTKQCQTSFICIYDYDFNETYGRVTVAH